MFVRIHIVQKGETLWRIAKQYGIGLDELKSLNSHLANPDYIVPGMEIILPDSATPTKSNMTKEQLTAPMPTKEMQTAPKEMQTAPKEMQTAPKEMQTAPKEMVTQEMPQMEMPPSPKEKMTQEMPAPVQPMPQPVMPQFDMTPQFHLDFAPQMHFQQPQPQPMPMPQPQPIFIEMPDIHMQHTHMQPVTDKEKEIEYVPVPQPQIIYVPVMPHFYPMPCGCHEQHYYEPPCGCHEQHHYQKPPCGCGCQEQYVQHEQQYMQPSPCGCGGSQSAEIMPYGVPYFEPNYDISPIMEEDYPHQEEQGGLPDWLKDSTELQQSEQVMGAYDEMKDEHHDLAFDDSKVADEYHEMYELDSQFLPKSQAYDGHYDSPHHMMPHMPHHMMPMQQQPMYDNMMPQQMYPNCQSYPYMNPYSPHYTPWKY